jgi:hypothetical protein
MGERWVSFRAMVDAIISARLVINQGHAHSLARQAIKSGEIRLSYMYHGAVRPPVTVIEFGSQAFKADLLAGKIHMNSGDLSAWINRRSATRERPRQERESYLTGLAREAATAIWGGPKAPPGLPPQRVAKLVADKVNELHGASITTSQVLRALGRKRA